MCPDSKQSDHDVIIETAADVRWLRAAMSNHIRHHWAVSIALGVVVLGGVITVIIKAIY